MRQCYELSKQGFENLKKIHLKDWRMRDILHYTKKSHQFANLDDENFILTSKGKKLKL